MIVVSYLILSLLDNIQSVVPTENNFSCELNKGHVCHCDPPCSLDEPDCMQQFLVHTKVIPIISVICPIAYLIVEIISEINKW